MKKAEAKAHFLKGIALLKDEAWAAALAEFRASRDSFANFSATNNAARALQKLQRFDESLDMYETALREFPNASAAERTFAQRAVVELRELVGTIEITGAEAGAAIVISGQNRGEHPSITPLRVSAGAHLVRIFKEGYEPFEVRVDVAGGQMKRVSASMHALRTSGRLKVAEHGGRTLEVLVDGVSVGQTPWEGTQAVGSHTVVLRGKGRAGTQPASVVVKPQQVTPITLVAEELDSALHVDVTPVGATVSIDAVAVDRGSWSGPLKSGPHRIEIAAEGFFPVLREINLERGGVGAVNVQLERNSNAAMWRKPSRWTFDGSVGVPLVPSLGSSCTGDCSASLGIGGLGLFNAGYRVGSGLGFGLAVGYLVAVQNSTNRDTPVVPNGLSPQPGTAADQLRLSAFLGGANVSYHLGETVPLLFRMGVGGLVGQLRDERRGTFERGGGNAVVDFQMPVYLYFDPEVRVGIRLGEHIDLSLGAQVLMLLALSQPKWDGNVRVDVGSNGLGGYKAEPTMDTFLFGIAPTASLLYDF